MFPKISICFGLCLLLGLGCTPVNSRISQQITVNHPTAKAGGTRAVRFR